MLEDIRQQVEAGATHITFGDPDFLNGPKHSLRVVRAMHEEFPSLTFDFTAKVEHLLKRGEDLPEFAAAGCLFIITAVESLSDRVLTILDKQHTRDEVVAALQYVRKAGIAPRPTWVEQRRCAGPSGRRTFLGNVFAHYHAKVLAKAFSIYACSTSDSKSWARYLKMSTSFRVWAMRVRTCRRSWTPGWCSFVLSYWMREQGLYSLGEGIRRMTSGPARVLGLTDRGTLAAGQRADVNVFDFGKVAELQPELVHDFPGGAPRYIQRSQGFKATIVNGQINVMDGEHTGIRAGRVLRHQA